jgi:hypothetical protein
MKLFVFFRSWGFFLINQTRKEIDINLCVLFSRIMKIALTLPVQLIKFPFFVDRPKILTKYL